MSLRTLPLFCISHDNGHNSLCGDRDPSWHVREADCDPTRMCPLCAMAAMDRPVDLVQTAAAIADYATTLVVPPQLFIVVVSDTEANLTVCRSNAAGGMAVVPDALRALARNLDMTGSA